MSGMTRESRVLIRRSAFLFAAAAAAFLHRSCDGQEERGVSSAQPWRCSAGHNIPPQYCTADLGLGLRILDQGADIYLLSSAAAGVPSSPAAASPVRGSSGARQWNVSAAPPAGAPFDSTTSACHDMEAFFIVIPYNDAFDGKVNYYHYHVDVLLPLFVAFQRTSLLGNEVGDGRVRALILPTVSRLDWHSSPSPMESGALPPFNWYTAAFSDPTSHWVRALQTMTDEPLLPFSADGLGRMRGQEPCFSSARFGLPSLEHPAPSTVKRFVGFMRSRLRLRDDPVPCDAPDEIGLVRRTNRRLLLNEEELVKAITDATGATVRLLNFGNGYESDVASVQSLRVLLGVQGSGLINGWYLPPRSGVVVLYQLGAWDVFEEYLAPRGPYSYWINGDPARSFCNKSIDRFCDSPDTLVDISEAVGVIRDSLAASRRHCNDPATTTTTTAAAAAAAASVDEL